MEWTEVKLPLPPVGETVLIDLGDSKLKLAKLAVDELIFMFDEREPSVCIDVNKVKRWMRIEC